MKKAANDGGLLPWSKPEVRRIDAGSAEVSNKGLLPDGGTSPSGTNFS